MQATATAPITLNQTSAATGRSRRSVRNYLIHRRFQLKWTGAIVLLTTLVFSTFAGTVYWSQATAPVDARAEIASAEMASEAAQATFFGAMMADVRGNLLSMLAVSGTLLVLALSVIGVVLTHKIAGPAYALQRSIERVRSGDWRVFRGLRKGDEFRSLADSWNRLIVTLRTKETAEIDLLRELTEREDLPVEVRLELGRLVAQKSAHLDSGRMPIS